MDNEEVVVLDDVICDNCEQSVFIEREGFYFCDECGIKKDQIRAVEVCGEDTFNDTNRFTQRTVKKPKQTKEDENEITSWEFYNYVLRGFVQELLNMGAKPELKLMALQVWAAYLGRMEAAFFKSNEVGLPRLSVRALPWDARIIYNHRATKRKRVRQQKGPRSVTEDVRSNWREWRKTKRKLDASSHHNASISGSSSHQVPSLALQWSQNARKSLKKVMPLKHLDKHSGDSTGSMQCHKLHPKATSLGVFDRNIYCLNLTKLYIVLGIALNLVRDDIQLTDLLRFIDEEHLTGRYVLGYLPENVAAKGKTLLKEISFTQQSDKVKYGRFDILITQMSRFIDMSDYQIPDIEALTQRYVLELSLPPVVATYASNLMSLMPPTFQRPSSPFTYPKYEARVMAYILYTMKLLFGLDDVKEIAISASAQKINEKLKLLASQQGEISAPPLLFVFTEWMEFVEMRKVLISQYNETFARRFGIRTNIGKKVDEYLDKDHKKKEHEYNCSEGILTPTMTRKRENLCLIFEKLLKQQFGESCNSGELKDKIEFQPCLTPAHTYFTRLLLHASRQAKEKLSVQIPSYMHVNHMERDIEPLKKQTAELSKYLAEHQYQLNLEELACQEHRAHIGIFQTIRALPARHQEWRANFQISQKDWFDNLKRAEKRPCFKFHQPVTQYGKIYQKRVFNRLKKRESVNAGNPYEGLQEPPKYTVKFGDNHLPLNSLHSIQTFDEDNMEPLPVDLEAPCRHLESRFPEKVKDELVATPEQPETPQEMELLTLKISNFDCWLLHGTMPAIRDMDKRELRTLFPTSFRWLLDTCSNTLGISWNIVYEQLIVLEVMFHHTLENMGDYPNHLRLKYFDTNKDIRGLSKMYKNSW